MPTLDKDVTSATFETLFGPEFGHGKPFDLDSLRAALDALGAPHQNLPPVIHVAGTNGKGSTIAFMRAIAEAAGLRVHAFTKPHLFRLAERFTLAGAPASDASVIAAAERIAAVAPELSQFDAQVAAAFLLFSETPADLALLETGMGGRDDSTNVIERPAACVITPIGLDHQDALGATLTKIAAHKAGILKSGVAAVIARQPHEAMQVIEARADELGAPLFRAGAEWDAYASHGAMAVQTETRAFDLPAPALYGAHQIDNAGLACAALLAAKAPISDDAFASGVGNAHWPGRLQPLTRGPFSAPIRALGGEVWVDGGHNGHAAAALANALAEMKARRGGATIVIAALRARKDAGRFLTALKRATDYLVAVPLRDGETPSHTLADFAQRLEMKAGRAPSLETAMQIAARFPAPRVLICGSLALAADALALEGG